MIEILTKSDIEKIHDQEVKNYLKYSFTRFPKDYKYPQFGYFILVTNFEDLLKPFIPLSITTLKGINNGLYDQINMVEQKGEIIEILVFIDNDINVSLVMPISIVEEMHRERLLSYQI